MSRLPQQFWRVMIVEGGDKLRTYDRGSKTYAELSHALNAIEGFASQGIKAELWSTGPVDWKCVQAAVPDNMDPLF